MDKTWLVQSPGGPDFYQIRIVTGMAGNMPKIDILCASAPLRTLGLILDICKNRGVLAGRIPTLSGALNRLDVAGDGDHLFKGGNSLHGVVQRRLLQ